jgi:hypothetical protein
MLKQDRGHFDYDENYFNLSKILCIYTGSSGAAIEAQANGSGLHLSNRGMTQGHPQGRAAGTGNDRR